MDNIEVNEIVKAIEGLKANPIQEFISTIFLPVLVVIITAIITLKINKRQNKEQFNYQLQQQKVVLKKEIKIKALIDTKNAILKNARTSAILNLKFNEFLRNIISGDEIYKILSDGEDTNRENRIIINSTKYLVTDFSIEKEDKYLFNCTNIIGHSIYYSFCFPDKKVPELLEQYILSINQCEKILEYLEEYQLKSCELMDSIGAEITKTINSIV